MLVPISSVESCGQLVNRSEDRCRTFPHLLVGLVPSGVTSMAYPVYPLLSSKPSQALLEIFVGFAKGLKLFKCLFYVSSSLVEAAKLWWKGWKTRLLTFWWEVPRLIRETNTRMERTVGHRHQRKPRNKEVEKGLWEVRKVIRRLGKGGKGANGFL